MNEQTHRLTDLPGERHPYVCQQCGGSNQTKRGQSGALIYGNGLMRLTVDRWQEHDHNDKPESRILVLCNVCSKRMIEPHPRLYNRLDINDPWPGCMDICANCKLRDGIKCTSPDAKMNGGAGVLLTLYKPMRGFIDGENYRGPFVQYPAPPAACKQKQIS